MTSSFHAIRRWAPLALLAAATLGCGQAQKAKEVVIPTATPEAIALIRDNTDRCARLSQTALTVLQSAEKVQAEWSLSRNQKPSRQPEEEQEPPQPPEPGRMLKEHLEGDAAPEVAAAKRASELIDRLISGIAAETSPQVADAVVALKQAHEELCDHLQPKDASAWTYERNRRRSLDNFERAEAKLEALYKVSPTDMQFAMRKYNPLLEQARSKARRKDTGPVLTAEEYEDERAEWEAVQELQTVQRAEHDIAVSRSREEAVYQDPEQKAKVGFAPDYAQQLRETPESRQQKFHSWYPSYAARATPVKQALAHYVEVRLGPASQVQPACQTLLDTTTAILNDPNALQAPDRVLPRILKGAYENLQQSASACLAGRTAEAAFRMTDYDRGIKKAGETLGQYSIVP